MSKMDNTTEAPLQEEKVVTRYDRKLQKRKEQAEKEKKANRISRIVTIAVLAVVVAVLASFPIRNYIALNQTYIEVDNEKVPQVEYDYHYNVALNAYYSQYGSALSMMGVDLTGDLSTQMYSSYHTWKDYFDQMAVESIKQTKALKAEAESAGFKFDTDGAWAEYKATLVDKATDLSITTAAYVQSYFGPYATLSRVKGFIKDSLYTKAYLDDVSKTMQPSDDEIAAYYEENKDSYDSVDFYLTQVNAELPTAPADEESDAEENTTYEPTEEEIAAAMEEAKAEAEKAEATVMTDGELREDYTKIYVSSKYNEWLFDASRVNGDTTVVEDTANNCYYVVGFDKRYLKENPTANARIISTETKDVQDILAEYNSGEQTEESFIKLVEKYGELQGNGGGLFEGLTVETFDSATNEWLFAEERKAGDTYVLEVEDSIDYIFYYLEPGEVEWKADIRSTLVATAVNEYTTALTEAMEVNDPYDNLAYPEIEEMLAEEAAAAEEAEETE